MKTLLFSLALAFTALINAQAQDPRLATVEAADNRRVAAFKAADQEALGTIFSDELRYAHSSGSVDDKASITATLVSGKTKYLSYDYEERKFTFPAPKIALMAGRVHLKVTTAAGGMDNSLSFLGVWREENGVWRFLAWQSCKLPVPGK